MQVFKRAWSDTWHSLGGWTVIYFVVAVPAVGFGLHYLIAGTGPMNAELQIWLIYGLAATGLVSLVLFAWNLACAPFRIERDRRVSAELEESEALCRLDAAKNEIPEYFQLVDSKIRNKNGVVAVPAGQVHHDGANNVVKFEGIQVVGALEEGEEYSFCDLLLVYNGSEIHLTEGGIGKSTQRHLGGAKFTSVRKLPIFLDTRIFKDGG